MSEATARETFNELGLTVAAVAQHLGISQAAVYQWERIPNGRRAAIEQLAGLQPGALGRSTSRQGFRSDLREDEDVPVGARRLKGLVWQNIETGAVVEPGKGDPPEGWVLRWYD